MVKASVQEIDPFAALESLRSSLDQAGIVFPSLRVDPQMEQLIELGRVRVNVALRLADALRREGPNEAEALNGECERVKRLTGPVAALCDHHDALTGARMCRPVTSRSTQGAPTC